MKCWPYVYSERQDDLSHIRRCKCAQNTSGAHKLRNPYVEMHMQNTTETHQQRGSFLLTHSRVRLPLARALALFSCLPGENICELFEWNLILEIT